MCDVKRNKNLLEDNPEKAKIYQNPWGIFKSVQDTEILVAVFFFQNSVEKVGAVDA